MRKNNSAKIVHCLGAEQCSELQRDIKVHQAQEYWYEHLNKQGSVTKIVENQSTNCAEHQCSELQGDIKVHPAQKSDIKYRTLLLMLLLNLENVKCNFWQISKTFVSVICRFQRYNASIQHIWRCRFICVRKYYEIRLEMQGIQ